MFGDTIRQRRIHDKILEKLGEPDWAPEFGASAGSGGLARPSWLGQAETGRNRQNKKTGNL